MKFFSCVVALVVAVMISSSADAALIISGSTEQAGGVDRYSVYASSDQGPINLSGLEITVDFSDPGIFEGTYSDASVQLIPTADGFFSQPLPSGPTEMKWNVLNFNGLGILDSNPLEILSFEIESDGAILADALMPISVLAVVDSVPFQGEIITGAATAQAAAVPSPTGLAGLASLGLIGVGGAFRRRRRA